MANVEKLIRVLHRLVDAEHSGILNENDIALTITQEMAAP